ncbi:MAG: hypothetical protein QNJ05_00905 [Woeseiaceae bacterium]|nr:hypothetical protein [Woeseiaceae bacterium]
MRESGVKDTHEDKPYIEDERHRDQYRGRAEDALLLLFGLLAH